MKISLASFRNLKLVVIPAIFYLAISFAFSFVGFVFDQPSIHFHEYSLPRVFIELGGHFLFGAIVAIPFLEWNLIVISGTVAVFIDSDHVLRALDLSTSSRPDHSIVFSVVAAVLLAYFSRRLGASVQTAVKILFMVPASLFAHISYDILIAYMTGGKGFTFPLFIPFSYYPVSFEFNWWIVFEVAGLLVCLLGSLHARSSKKGHGPHSIQIDLVEKSREKDVLH